ncbi:choline binding protein [Streptococcus pneumoniae 2070335]|nr:choline binding protein [Streptococcus pneumoniae 2070335]HET5954759.1 hypothetical protein [Streptococcus pneumoniae]HET8292534.1 hypothetical protein [Streptococcus pneumoniae]HEU2142242.1 hypothetical protein [Streptococcus pneumoniae]HEU9130585.1 hypothetical protein [Streptococcus pneumoniae]
MVKRRIRRGTREPEKVVVPEQSSIPSYPVSVTSNQGTDVAVEPAKAVAPTTDWKQEMVCGIFIILMVPWQQVGYKLMVHGTTSTATVL